MEETLIQFVVGGLLVFALMALDREHFRELTHACFPNSPKLQHWVKLTTKIAMIGGAATCWLDPLIPGSAALTVSVPATSAIYARIGVMDNLRLRVAPTGVAGPAGGERIDHVAFDATGSTEVIAKMTFLETALNLEIYDQTDPDHILRSVNIYISPFVRQHMFSKQFTF
jgi:hypothetical protein